MAGLLGLLFPRRCACCGQIIREEAVCDRCRERLRYVEPPICKRCGSALSDCHCENRRYAFDRAVAAMVYADAVKDGIKRFKFNGRTAAGRFFAEEMIRYGFKPLLRFDRSSLANLMLSLEANFGVRFVVPRGIDIERGAISADFEGLSLQEIVLALSVSDKQYSYSLGENTITITNKKIILDE